MTLDEAKEILASEKKGGRQSAEALKELGESPKTKKPVKIMKGRFGPYITDGSKVFASLPKDKEPEEITLEEALALLAAKKKKKK